MKSGTFKRILSLLLVVAMSFSVFATPVAYALEGDDPNTEISSEQKEEISSEQKEEISSEQKEEISSEQKEEISSEQKEEISSEQKEEISSEQKEEISSEQEEEEISSEQEEQKAEGELNAPQKGMLGMSTMALNDPAPLAEEQKTLEVIALPDGKLGAVNLANIKKYLDVETDDVGYYNGLLCMKLTEKTKLSAGTHTIGKYKSGFIPSLSDTKSMVCYVPTEVAINVVGAPESVTPEVRVEGEMPEGWEREKLVVGGKVTLPDGGQSFVITATDYTNYTYSVFKKAKSYDYDEAKAAKDNAVKLANGKEYTVVYHAKIGTEDLTASLDLIYKAYEADTDEEKADAANEVKKSLKDQIKAQIPKLEGQTVTLRELDILKSTDEKKFGYDDQGRLLKNNKATLRVGYTIALVGGVTYTGTLDYTVTVVDERDSLAIVLPERPFTIVYEAPHEGHSTLYNRVLNNMSAIKGTDSLNVEKLTIELDEEYPEVSLLGTTVTLTVIADPGDTFATTSKEFKVIVLPHASSLDVKNTTWVYGDAENSVDKLSEIITTDPADLDYLAIATGVNYAPGGYASLVVPKAVQNAMRVTLPAELNGLVVIIKGTSYAGDLLVNAVAAALKEMLGVEVPTDAVKALIRVASAFEKEGGNYVFNLYRAVEILVGDGVQVGEVVKTLTNLSKVLAPLLGVAGAISGSEQVSAVLNGIISLIESIDLDVNLLLTLNKAPTEAGIYTVAAISVDPNYTISADVGLLHIVPKNIFNSSVELEYVKQLPANHVLSWSAAQKFEFGAQQVEYSYGENGEVISKVTVNYKGEENNASRIKTLFTGMEFDGNGVAKNVIPEGDKAPRNPGFYTQTALVIGGNYWTAPISRTYTIQRQTVKLELDSFTAYVDADKTVPTLTVTTESTEESDAEIVKGKTTIYYTGVTASGRPYGSSTAPTEAGVYTATATFAGDPMFQPAVATARFTLKKHDITLKMDGDTVTYDGRHHTLKYEAYTDSGNKLDDSDVSLTYTYMVGRKKVTTTDAPTDAGVYTVTATVASTNEHKGAVVTATLTIKKAEFHIEWDNGETDDMAVSYDGQPHEMKAKVVIDSVYSDDKEKDDAIKAELMPEITGAVRYRSDAPANKPGYNSKVAPTNAGKYIAYAEYNGGKNFEAASYPTAILTITPAQFKVVMENKIETYNGEHHTLNPEIVITGDYSDEVKDALLKELEATLTGSVYYYPYLQPLRGSFDGPVDAGVYGAKATYDSHNSNFASRKETTATLTVVQAPATYEIDTNSLIVEYNGEAQAINFAETDGVGNMLVWYVGVGYNGNYHNSYKAPTDAGNYKVYVSYSGDKNHYGMLPKYVGTLTIVPRRATITIHNKSKLVGTQDPALSCTVDNLVEGESLAFELYREEGEAVGVYPIRANVKKTGNNRNYLITIVGEGMGVPRGINDEGYALFTIYAAPAPEQFVSPKTGDASNMALYIAVLCMSVLGIAGLAVVSKRKHN